MSVDDAAHSRRVQREISRRNIDISEMDIHVSHGIVYLRGRPKTVRGSQVDLRHEFQIVEHILRGIPGIRSIVDELQYR